MRYQSFDIKSELTAVGNALIENEAHIKSLNAQLQEAEEYQRHLSWIISQRIGAIFSESGTPDFDGMAMIRKIEANVQRSVSRVVADRKKQGRDHKQARTAAIDKARIVCDRYHLNDLTDSMSRHVDETVAKVYGLKKPSLLEKQRLS